MNGCATPRRESLSLFMYREPKAAKRAAFRRDPAQCRRLPAIPRRFSRQDAKQQLANPVWHIHAGHPPAADMPVTFQLLLTLVSSSNARMPPPCGALSAVYRPASRHQTHPKLDAMVGYAINLCDFVAPTKKFREPTPTSAPRCRSARCAVAIAARRVGRGDPERGLRDRPARAVLDAVKKGKDGRPGVSLDWFNMLYRCCSVRKRPALRLGSSRSMAWRTP